MHGADNQIRISHIIIQLAACSRKPLRYSKLENGHSDGNITTVSPLTQNKRVAVPRPPCCSSNVWYYLSVIGCPAMHPLSVSINTPLCYLTSRRLDACIKHCSRDRLQRLQHRMVTKDRPISNSIGHPRKLSDKRREAYRFWFTHHLDSENYSRPAVSYTWRQQIIIKGKPS